MVPSLMIAVAAFACFLIVLSVIAYAAFRVAARREAPLGVPGGCALAAVLLGMAFFAMIGLVVFLAVSFFHEHPDGIRDGWRQHLHEQDPFEPHWEVAPAVPEPDAPSEPADAEEPEDGVRQY
ncbi:MAG TPA: hypothetical protein VM509_01965 [Planctomycetota bacterium]|nr:hypothetical protein [Planctomycetota bacterium]